MDRWMDARIANSFSTFFADFSTSLIGDRLGFIHSLCLEAHGGLPSTAAVVEQPLDRRRTSTSSSSLLIGCLVFIEI